MSAAISYGPILPDRAPPPAAARALPRRMSAHERSVLALRLDRLRRDLREEFRRARFAAGYARERRRQLATEAHPVWAAHCRKEIEHAIPYITRHRAEIRHLRATIGALTESMGAL